MSRKRRICGAGFPTCGFTGHSSPVFQKNWRLESRLNPQTGMSAPHLNAWAPAIQAKMPVLRCAAEVKWC